MERKSLYVTQSGARIHRADGLVAVSVDRALVDRWPPEDIEHVLVFGNAQVTTQALGLLFRHGVHVSFFTPAGRYRGQVVSPESGSVFLRLAQHARFADTAFRLAFAKDLVSTKVRAARALVRRFARNHPNSAEVAETAADRLDDAVLRVEQEDDIEALRGVEGAAAAEYFRAFDSMVRAPFRFERRSKHPAHNPVNALLNLGYTLLAGEIAGRLESAGFDPRVGYFHGVRYGRSSLALDLIEAHRVDTIDRLTLALLNRRMFAPEDFEDRGGSLGVRFTPPALRRFLAHYETAMGESTSTGDTPRARVRSQVALLRRSVMGGVGSADGESEARNAEVAGGGDVADAGRGAGAGDDRTRALGPSAAPVEEEDEALD